MTKEKKEEKTAEDILLSELRKVADKRDRRYNRPTILDALNSAFIVSIIPFTISLGLGLIWRNKDIIYSSFGIGVFTFGLFFFIGIISLLRNEKVKS